MADELKIQPDKISFKTRLVEKIDKEGNVTDSKRVTTIVVETEISATDIGHLANFVSFPHLATIAFTGEQAALDFRGEVADFLGQNLK